MEGNKGTKTPPPPGDPQHQCLVHFLFIIICFVYWNQLIAHKLHLMRVLHVIFKWEIHVPSPICKKPPTLLGMGCRAIVTPANSSEQEVNFISIASILPNVTLYIL